MTDYNERDDENFGSDYMLRYFARYVSDWTLLYDPWYTEAKAMLHCIHDGYNYREGLIQGFNTEEEFNYFDKYNLLKDNFKEINVGNHKYQIRYFKKDFVKTFTEEDWYSESIREAEEDMALDF